MKYIPFIILSKESIYSKLISNVLPNTKNVSMSYAYIS